MAAKRARAGADLTGGTGDVNPQFLSGQVVLSAANTATTLSLGIPIQRVDPNNQAIVLEALKVYVNHPAWDAIASAGEATDSQQVMFSTTSFGTTAVNFAEPRVFAASLRSDRGAFTAAGTYGMNQEDLVVIDLTDGAGHGILIATDNIFVQGMTGGFAGAATFNFKIMYRWKRVNITEYIGIVQSQQ